MKRPCPVCGSVGSRRALYRQRFVDGGALGDGYEVMVCEECGAGFADGIPTQAELDRYYAERSKYEYAGSGGEESPYDFHRFKEIVGQVMPFVPARDAAILDVGCATGGLLACFAREGYTQLLGSDPSPACGVAARKLHGIEVRRAAIGELVQWNRRFDLIVLVGVLEHLRDVAPALEIVSGLLASDGLIYCAQPDVESFADCHNAPYQQFSVEHVNFFSAGSLRRVMARAGLSEIRSWRWMIEWREGVTDSVVSGLYSRGRPVPAASPDAGTRVALERYLAQSHRQELELMPALDHLIQSGESVLVWGAGTLARRLLASSRLGQANIAAFVDSDPHLQGERLAGREILSPQQLSGRGEPIMICSKAFAQEIRTTIREQLKLTNRILEMEGW